MKLKNKKTGEIGIVESEEIPAHRFIIRSEKTGECYVHSSLAELNEEWEDYEEPKEIYFISNNGQIHEEDGHDRYRETRKQIGNYFETKEEAEKAVKKLKAWKRLKDKGFRLNHWKEAQLRPNMSCVAITGNMKVDEEAKLDLDLLFEVEND